MMVEISENLNYIFALSNFIKTQILESWGFNGMLNMSPTWSFTVLL